MNRYQKSTLCCGLGIALSLSAPVASIAANTPQVIRSGDIIVSGTRTERTKTDLPMAVDLVPQEEISRFAGQSIIDQLRDIPGIVVTDGGGPGIKYIQIRGESTRRTLYLIDGQPISQQKSMQGGMPLIARNQIERIEVVKGPASVLYGSEAIGGVVNIITKKGGDSPIGGEVNLNYDSGNDGFRHDYTLQGSKDGFEYNASFGKGSWGDRKTARETLDHAGTSIRDPLQKRKSGSGSDIQDYSLYLGKKTDSLYYGVRYDFHDLAYDVYTPRTELMDVYMSLPMTERRKLGAFFEAKDLSETWKKVRVDLYRQATNRDHYIWRDAKMARPPMDFTTTTRTYNEQVTLGGEVVSEWELGGHHLIAGLTVARDDIDGSYRTITRDGPAVFPPSLPATERSVYDADSTTTAAFFQDEWQITPATRLVGGVRLTRVSSALNFTDDPGIAIQKDDSTDSHLGFSLGLVHRVNDQLTLRSNYSQGYRHANIVEQYIGSPPGMGSSTSIAGNPDLKPETSHSIEFGGIYRSGPTVAEAAVFYTTADDYISTDPVSFINVGGADTLGAELSLAYTIGETGLTPYGSATWLRRTFNFGPGKAVSSTTDSGVAKLTGRGGMRYERLLGDGFLKMDLFSRFTSSIDVEYSNATRDSAPSWDTVNMEVSYLMDNFPALSGNHELSSEFYAGLYNAFDKYYVPFNERPAAGRHFNVGMIVRF